jgi:hypothetical protein
MTAPAPATAGELLRIDPLELRFPCTLLPSFFLRSLGEGKIPLFLSSLFLSAWIDRLVTLLMFFP